MKKQITIDDIEQALKKKEFTLHYQPKLSMATGEICGAEALLRWKTIDGEYVSPDTYISVAEEAGFVTKITAHVFDLLVKDLPQIVAVNQKLLISFNTSGKDFYDHDFTEYVIRYINDNKNYIANIEIEVTESVLLNKESAIINLSELSEMGITISMDDFGTGHSGLAELSKWPFDTVKIDKSIVNGIYHSSKNTEILQASIRMAHQLNVEIVAEGIEDEYTYTLLEKYGCHTGQGYWISHPLEITAFLDFIEGHTKKETFPIGILYMSQLDHLQWRKTLIDSAFYIHKEHRGCYEKKVMGGPPDLRRTHCKLGKWYYSAESVFGHLKEYKDLEIPHKELHEIGERLINAAYDNCSSHELGKLIKQLTKKSIIIFSLIQDLENHWMLQQHAKAIHGDCPDSLAISSSSNSETARRVQ